MQNVYRLMVVLVLVSGSLRLSAQGGSFYVFGFGVAQFRNTSALDSIIGDFNAHFGTNGNQMSEALESPGTVKGFLFGFKADNDLSHLGMDFHTHNYWTTAEWRDSNGVSYEKQLRLVHHGFSINLGLNLIHAEGFRTGPVLSFNIEQMRIKTNTSNAWIIAGSKIPTDIFYFSPSLKWPLSFGGEKFNFDIIPYYQLPLYRMNLTKLNSSLNDGYARSYTKEAMRFYPDALGLWLTLNFPIGS